MADLQSRGVPGVSIRLGIGNYVLAPITVGQFCLLEEDNKKLWETEDDENKTFKIQGGERFKLRAKFIRASLARNYDAIHTEKGVSALTDETILEILDLANIETAFQVAMGISQVAPSGEATAVVETTTQDSSDSSTA